LSDDTRRDWRDLDKRLDEAINALNDERAPILFEGDDPDLVELIDTARIVRHLREPAEPDDDFPDRLVAAVATRAVTHDNTALVPDGRVEMARQPVVLPRGRSRVLLAQLAAVLRVIGVCVLAGMLAGALVGGLGGRAAMRVSGELYEREHPGQMAVTESSGEPVGQISFGGTLSLIVEVTVFFGLPCGLLYLLVAPWLPGTRHARGLVFAGVLLAIGGAAVIDSDNQDFQRLGSPLLNLVMFAALILSCGGVIVFLADWLDRATRVGGELRVRRTGATVIRMATMGAGAGGVLAGMMLSALFAVSALRAIITRDTPSMSVAVLSLTLFVALPLARLAVALPNRGIAARLGGQARVRRLAWLALGLAVATTLAQLIPSVSTILTGA
jgi:hypothetical protein